MDRIIEKTMKNLEKNNISAFYAESREEVAGIIKSLVPAGSTVSNGGSETLAQTGVMDLLSGGDYVFYDRRGLEGEELRAVMCGLLDVTRISALPMRSPKTVNFIMWTAIPTALPALFTGQNRLLW